MKRSILSFVFLVTAGLLFAQVSMVNSVLATAGAYQTNGSYSLSWTVGELAVSTLTEGSNVLTQGFQQPWDMAVNIADGPEINWSVKAYPNPVYDYLNVKFSLEKSEEFTIEVTDITGKKVLTREPQMINTDEIVDLDFAQFKPGIYFLMVYSSDQKVHKVYKIKKQ
ncbi:MAG: T9SS type A sorting domain-containing protein [Bacteroidota bacterium]|nr:T9SS type A sorting domain-containing protein [Bacteroidota bacterium]